MSDTDPKHEEELPRSGEDLQAEPDRSPDLAAAGAGGLAALVGGALAARLLRSARLRLRLPRLRGRPLRRFGLGILIVVSSVATCSYGVDPAELARPYGDPAPTSVDDAKAFLERGADALSGLANDNTVRVAMTESEATSVLSLGLMIPDLALVAERIPREEIQSSRDLEALRQRILDERDAMRREALEHAGLAQRVVMLLDPRIRSGDVQIQFEGSGQVVVAGYVQAWGFRQAGVFVVAPSVENGQLRLDFVEGRLGRLPAPKLVFDLLGKAFSSALLLGREYVEISDIAVEEGTFRFVGRIGTGRRS